MQREQGGIQSAIASEESKIQVLTLLAILPLGRAMRLLRAQPSRRSLSCRVDWKRPGSVAGGCPDFR